MSYGLTRKSLQKKVSLTLLGVMAVLALLIYAVVQRVVAPAFDQLEIDNARTNLVRAERAIQNDLHNLSAITGDWAMWDDAFAYVRGENPAFRDSNLDRPTLVNLGLNVLAIYDAQQRLVWGQVADGDVVLDPGSLGILDPGSPGADMLLNLSDPATNIGGLIGTSRGPMLISAWPVVRSDGSGPIAGTMVMGQLLTDAREALLRERTEVLLDWMPVSFAAEIDALVDAPLNAPGERSIRHITTQSDVISTGVLVDLFADPLLQLSVRTPRNVSALGSRTVDGALVFLGLVAFIVAVVTWLLLRKMIVLPLEGLASHIVAMRKSGDLTRKLEDSRHDEIGALSAEFNKLTYDLYEARNLLLDQSFKAGKADNAAEVLHNIRNAMTPLINGIERLTKGFTVSTNLKVGQALTELSGPDCKPERAMKLLQYIESAFLHIESTSIEASGTLSIASTQARHVEAILADQEKHARIAPLIERLDLDDLLEEAMLVIPVDEDPGVEVKIDQKLTRLSVTAHRVSLLQVLGNLILNAYESIERCKGVERRIVFGAREEEVDERAMVRLTVSDTGCGFDAETGEKIFQRGFSSKKGNLSGLGLHWCANALAGMGGRIQADSPGPGQGAAFHVFLPAAGGLT